MATVLPFPTVYRIAYSDGDVTGLVEDTHGRAITFHRFTRAEEALDLLRQQHPAIFFWICWRPNA